MSLPAERPGTAASPDLAAWRAGLDAAVAGGMFATDPAPEAVTLAGVDALRFAPGGATRGTMLHFHGGGFRLGRPEQVAPFAAALAQRTRMTVICPRYRLAPEHPFPAALHDAWAAYRALAKDGPIVVSGDSAGGGIAAGLTALAAGEGVPPRALILLSAWLDLTVGAGSYAANAATDSLFSIESARAAAALYLGDADPAHPLASPASGPVEGFPPTFVNVGTGEVLADDSCRMHARLVAAGVDAELHVVPDMEHVAVTRGVDLTGSAETFAAVAGFIDRIADTSHPR